MACHDRTSCQDSAQPWLTGHVGEVAGCNNLKAPVRDVAGGLHCEGHLHSFACNSRNKELVL